MVQATAHEADLPGHHEALLDAPHVAVFGLVVGREAVAARMHAVPIACSSNRPATRERCGRRWTGGG